MFCVCQCGDRMPMCTSGRYPWLHANSSTFRFCALNFFVWGSGKHFNNSIEAITTPRARVSCILQHLKEEFFGTITQLRGFETLLTLKTLVVVFGYLFSPFSLNFVSLFMSMGFSFPIFLLHFSLSLFVCWVSNYWVFISSCGLFNFVLFSILFWGYYGLMLLVYCSLVQPCIMPCTLYFLGYLEFKEGSVSICFLHIGLLFPCGGLGDYAISTVMGL